MRAGQRADRRRVCRLFSSRVAFRPHRLLRQSVRSRVRSEQSCLVIRRLAGPAAVQWQASPPRRSRRRVRSYDADVATYRETVLTAIQQVEDALVGHSNSVARGQGAGGGRPNLPAGDADHAQRIQGVARQAFTAVVTAETQQLGAEKSLLLFDPGPAPG